MTIEAFSTQRWGRGTGLRWVGLSIYTAESVGANSFLGILRTMIPHSVHTVLCFFGGPFCIAQAFGRMTPLFWGRSCDWGSAIIRVTLHILGLTRYYYSRHSLIDNFFTFLHLCIDNLFSTQNPRLQR